MKQVTQEEFYAAVNKAASSDPMPTREYQPIVKDGITIGQRSNWETQRGGRMLFGITENIYARDIKNFFLQ